MTRNGKIARLPYEVREELNRRMRDGQSGSALLKWLNENPECLDVLDEEFESRPVTKQNLSEWRQGGYEDWVRKEESRQRLQVLMEKAEDLEKDAGGMAIADRLGTLLSAELAVAMEQLDKIEDPKERWARVKEIARELHRLRREDHHARKLRMAEEQYEQQEKEAETKRLLKLQEAMQNKRLANSIRGGGEETWKWADWEIRVRHGLPMPQWWTNPQTAEEWSRLMMPYWWEEGEKGKNGSDTKVEDEELKMENGKRGSHRRDARATKAKSKAVRPGRSKSGQKSDSVAPGPSESESETKGTSQKSTVHSPQSAVDPPSPGFGAVKGPGSGDEAKTGVPSLSKFENEDEDEDEQGASGQ